MKELKAFMLAGGITMALSLGISAAIASDTNDGPTADQIKNSKSRGLIAVPLAPPTTTAPRSMTSITKPPVTHDVTMSQPAKKPPVAVKATTPPKTVKVETVKPAPQAVASHKQHSVAATSTVHKNATASVHTTKAPIKTTSTPVSTPAPAPVLASTDDSSSNVLKAWLNKSDQHYKTGERMEINVSSDRDCNVVIFDFDGKGTLTQLFPNQYQPNGTLKSGETVTVGGQASPFDYTANLVDGQQRSEEKLFVYAYPTDKETPLSVAMNPVQSTPFRSSKLTPSEYKKMVAHAPTFFQSQDRNVKITPKANVKMVSSDSAQSPNKIELPVVIER